MGIATGTLAPTSAARTTKIEMALLTDNLSVQNVKHDKANDELLCSQSSRSRNADAQMPPNLPTLDEEGGGAHQGLMQPVLVRPVDRDKYELIAGERRWRAAQMAGLSEVPALVREVPDESALALSLIENIQR